jgi:trimethylamine:corrinoid methyltransferase-like protein
MHLLDSMLDMDTQSFDSWTQRLREDTVNDAHRQVLRRLRDYLKL